MLITVRIYLPFPLILSKSNFEGISQADLHSASQGKRVKRTLEKRYLLEIHPLPICGSLFRHSLSRAALSQYTLSQVDVCSFASPFSLFYTSLARLFRLCSGGGHLLFYHSCDDQILSSFLLERAKTKKGKSIYSSWFTLSKTKGETKKLLHCEDLLCF